MTFTVKTRKVMSNPLLKRKQMVLDIFHPKLASVSKVDIRSALAKKFNIEDDQTIFVFGFRIAFGGEKSTGFATIYDNLESALEVEPKFRLIRNEIVEAEGTKASRIIRRQAKNKRKNLYATQKDKGKKKRRSDDE